jgi:hypothetical protein
MLTSEAGMETLFTESRYAYAPGEEVVVRLEGAEAHNIERAAAVAPACLPEWTIGVVLGCTATGGTPAYVLRIEHDGCACVCTVPEAAIEGTA